MLKYVSGLFRLVDCRTEPSFKDISFKILMNPTKLNAFLSRLAISQSKASRFNSLITIGSRVVLKNLAIQETFTLKIVSTEKARPQMGEISCLSIIGTELLGQQQGAIFTIDTPNGQELWQVLKVGD